MAAPIRLIFLCGILAVFIVGLVDYLTNFEKNGCQMTYMYEYPEYLKIELTNKLVKKYPNYGLYIYGEGNYAAELRKSTLRLKGIPVLFIPGNAGSYKQVRSLGSVAYRKGYDSGAKFHFNFFSLDLNEELSGLFGGVLQDQTEFAAYCIKHIMTLYKGAPSPPKSVLVVGHSMGGIIARGLFTLPKFDKNLVHTILTQATPHQGPVVSIDSYIGNYYSNMNNYWMKHHNTTLKDVRVISTSGGLRDLLVRSDLTSLTGIVDSDKGLSSNTMSVPRAFSSTDHLCHVWCKQIVMATVRAMFDIVDRNTRQIAANPNYRLGAFQHHLIDTPGSHQYKGAYTTKITLDSKVKWSVRKVNPWHFKKAELNETRYSVVAVPQIGTEDYGYVTLSNIDNVEWLITCKKPVAKAKPSKAKQPKKQNAKKEDRCHNGVNISPTASMLPPHNLERRVLTLTGEQMTGMTHVVSIIPKSKIAQEISGEMYRTSKRWIEYNVTDLWAFIAKFPTSVMDLDMIIKKTESKALYYNITLRGMEVPLQAYVAYLTTIDCKENTGHASIMRFHVPWAEEDVYSLVYPSENGKLSLKLQNGPTKNRTEWPSLHLYLNPQCTYKLAVAVSWSELFGQFVRFYGTYLPAFVVMQIMMTIAYQLKQLDEEATIPSLLTSHSNYAQPWRIVPAALIVRFMLYFPEDMPLASRLYLPPDDTAMLLRLGSWYAALPIMLYLIGYSIFGLYSFFVTGIIGVMAKVFAFTLKRCCISVRVVSAASWMQYGILFACLPIAGFVCGTLAIIIVYFVFFVKMLWTYSMAYYSGIKEKQIWNRHNMCLSLVILLMLTVVLNGPSLVFWVQHLVNNSEFTLKSDPSRNIGIAVTLSAILLCYAQFPRISSELFGAMSSVIYFSSVLMVVFCLTSIHRISYFICTTLFLISIPAAILKYYFIESDKHGESTSTNDKDEDEKESGYTSKEKVIYEENSDNEDDDERGEIIPKPEKPHMTYSGDDLVGENGEGDVGDIGKGSSRTTRARKRNKKMM